MNLLDKNEDFDQFAIQNSDDTFDQPLVPRWIFSLFGFICVIAILGFVGYLAWPSFRAAQLARAAGNYAQRGNFEKALEAIDGAIAIRPKEPKYRYFRGWWRRVVGRHKEAIEDLQLAAESGFHKAQVYRLIAFSYRSLGEYEKSMEAHQKELEASTDSLSRMTALNNLAYARAVAGKELEQALREANEAIAIVQQSKGRAWRSSLGSFLDTRGFILYQLGQYEKSISDMNKAVQQSEVDLQAGQSRRTSVKELKRQLAVVLYHRGLVLAKLAKPAAAKRDFDKVKELGFHPGKELN